MKIVPKILFAAALATATTGCESFLDINNNPNAFTPDSVTPNVVLASALNTTAALYTGGNPSFNSYASWVAGYWAKTNVVSGYGEEQTYNYSILYYSGLFENTYDNLTDYDVIQTRGAADGYPNHAAIARIMKVYDFLLLVDEYGDIPYTNALQGAGNVTPTYDSARDIYKDLLVQLTGAIADINGVGSGARSVGSEDIVFGGDMTKWKQFANSLKLRILLRESQTNDPSTSDVKTQLLALQSATDGFITADVVVQPGYAQNANQQNPLYNRYAYNTSGTGATERNYQVATQYIIDQYEKNNDPRLSQLYTRGARVPSGGTTPVAQYVGAVLGEASAPGVGGTATASTRQASRFLGANSTSASGGILKGLNAPTALMLLSEQFFNKAEAETRGLFTGGDTEAKKDFLNGIKASFIYFYRPASTSLAAINASTIGGATDATPGVTQYNTFIATTAAGGSNATNPQVNYDVATTNGLGKQPIIIYQKYLAMNSVASTEAWDDIRRTGLPKIPLSLQAAQGKLPTRLLYPQSEFSTNQANVPANVTQYTKIFWDVVD